jgi:hypothetical protein
MAVAEGMGAAGTWADSAAPESVADLALALRVTFWRGAWAGAVWSRSRVLRRKAAADDGQGRKACMHDALTVCAKFIPDREQIANCLMANRERISQSCRLLLSRAH